MSRTFTVELTHQQIEQFLQLSKTLQQTFGDVVPTDYRDKTTLVKFFSKVKSYEDMVACAIHDEHRGSYFIPQKLFNAFLEFFLRKCQFTDFVYRGKENQLGSPIDAEVVDENGSQVLVFCHYAHSPLLNELGQRMFGDINIHAIDETTIGNLMFCAKAQNIKEKNRIIFTPLKKEDVVFAKKLEGMRDQCRVFAREEQQAIIDNYPNFWEELQMELISKL